MKQSCWFSLSWLPLWKLSTNVRLFGLTVLKSLPTFGSLTVVLWLCNWVFLLRSADVRLEEFVYEKLEKKAPTRMNNHELLGQSMIESGNEFGPGTAYGEWYTELPDILRLKNNIQPLLNSGQLWLWLISVLYLGFILLIPVAQSSATIFLELWSRVNGWKFLSCLVCRLVKSSKGSLTVCGEHLNNSTLYVCLLKHLAFRP